MARRCKTDWFKLLVDLKRLGYSYKKIKELTNIPSATIAGFKYGSEPKHGDGENLIKLWCFATGAEREDAPRVTRRSLHY